MGLDKDLGYYFSQAHMQGQVVMDASCLPPVQGAGVRFPLRLGVMCQFSFPPFPLFFPTDQYLPSPVATSEPQERHQTKRGREEKRFWFLISSTQKLRLIASVFFRTLDWFLMSKLQLPSVNIFLPSCTSFLDFPYFVSSC